MREEALEEQAELRSGKGVRVQMTSKILNWLNETITDMNEAWDAAEKPHEAFDALRSKWDTFAEDQYGKRTWRAVPYRQEDEMRITVVLRGGRLSVDFREWYQPH